VQKPEDVSKSLSRYTAQFVAFRVADQTYAFRIDQIKEIVILTQVTRTPQVPDYVEGVANLRGSIIPIVNIRRLFGLTPQPNSPDTRTIVVNVGGKTIGCIVDSVTQVVRIDHDAIQSVPETVTCGGANYISGFAKLKDELIVLLEVDEMLDPQKLEQVSQSFPSTSIQ